MQFLFSLSLITQDAISLMEVAFCVFGPGKLQSARMNRLVPVAIASTLEMDLDPLTI